MLLLGIRNQIFQHVFKNSDGYYALAEDYLTANTMIKCDADWTQARRLLSQYIHRSGHIPPVHTVTIDEVQEVYDNYNQYVSGKMKSSTTGYGIQALPELDLRFVTTK